MHFNAVILILPQGTMGDGTLSKMPTLTNSARPAVEDMTKLTEYHTKGTSGVNAPTQAPSVLDP